MSNENKHVYASECCGSSYSPLPEPVTQQILYGTATYTVGCNSCGQPCSVNLIQLFDSAGKEIRHEDLVECPERAGSTYQWHRARFEYGSLVLRDENHNCGTYEGNGGYFTRGPTKEFLEGA
jgi:hypothetical protein